jgi:hypothetical protein
VLSARTNALDLVTLLLAKRPADSKIEQLGVAEYRIERCAELVAHCGNEIALRLASRFGFGPGGTLTLELLSAFLRTATLRDIANRHETRRLAVPGDVDDPQLRGDRCATRPHDIDRSRLAVGYGEAELSTKKMAGTPAKEMLGSRIRESYEPIGPNDHDTVSQLGDDRAKLPLLLPATPPSVCSLAPFLCLRPVVAVVSRHRLFAAREAASCPHQHRS